MAKKARTSSKSSPDRDAQFRRCLVSGERRHKSELIRFVVGPENRLVADLSARLPGRGMWLGADRKILARAIKQNAFTRAARQPVDIPPDLADLIERLLAESCLRLFGLALKSGHLATGFERVLDWTETRLIAAIVEASDGQPDGRKKVLNRASYQPGPVLIAGCFSRDELSLALGRENVVHAALEDCSLARTTKSELTRLSGFRALCPPEWGVSASAMQDNDGPDRALKDTNERDD